MEKLLDVLKRISCDVVPVPNDAGGMCFPEPESSRAERIRLLSMPIIDNALVATDLEAGMEELSKHFCREYRHGLQDAQGSPAIVPRNERVTRGSLTAILAACGIQEAKQGVATDLEAGAKKLCELLMLTEVPRRAPWDDSNDAEYKQHFRDALHAILTACGIRAVDEVVEGVLTTKGGHDGTGRHRVVLVENPSDDGGCKGWHELGYLGDRVTITITHKEGE